MRFLVIFDISSNDFNGTVPIEIKNQNKGDEDIRESSDDSNSEDDAESDCDSSLDKEDDEKKLWVIPTSLNIRSSIWPTIYRWPISRVLE